MSHALANYGKKTGHSHSIRANKKNPLLTNKTDDRTNRDSRFRHILKNQLGENGLALVTGQSFLFVLVLIMIVSVILGFLSTLSHCNASLTGNDRNDKNTTTNRFYSKYNSNKK